MAMYNQQSYDPYYTSPQEYRYNPYYDTYTYNQQWRDYSSTSYNGINQYVQPISYYHTHVAPYSEEPTTAEVIEMFAADTLQFQQSCHEIIQSLQQSLQKLESLAEPMETSMSEYKIQCSNSMPSQVESSPMENVKAIPIQSGTQLESLPHQEVNDLIPSHEVKNSSLEESSPPKGEYPILVGPPSLKKSYKQIVPTYVSPPPFPSRLKKLKKEEPIKEIPETLPKVEVKIPWLEEIKEEPHFANTLEELCQNEIKLNGGEKVSVGEKVNVVLQRKLFPETSDSYIIEMEDEGDPNLTSTLFGRPFLLTASKKLDTKAWTLRMEFDGETLKFKVLDSIQKYIKNVSLLEDPT
ncbi:uncharacterized protein LOC133038401 [Cannabis sativa]|uniref:uncharacterized protein LOC133038401 n=1 Tax=Cannabis sativa TaxID=3483 RepID=UPI0029C9C8F4|nr:uncharacterized protein LOC133038401 [Cannabis sativa]